MDFRRRRTVIDDSSTLTNGIVAYYNFEEAAGDLLDQVGSNDGTITGTAYEQAGVVNYGYVFDTDGNDLITMGDVADFDLAQLSVSIWIKTVYDYDIFNNWASGNGWWIRMTSAGKLQWLIGTSPYPDVYSNASLRDNAWHHVVCTYDESIMKLYIDNVLQDDTASSSVTITYTGTTSFIGDRTGGTNFEGSMDELGVWNRALTQAEVTELYNGGSGATYPFT